MVKVHQGLWFMVLRGLSFFSFTRAMGVFGGVPDPHTIGIKMEMGGAKQVLGCS